MYYPVKYRMHGDEHACRELIGQARRCMFLLESVMELSKSQHHEMSFVPRQGELIVAAKRYGQKVVDIYAGGEVPIPEESKERFCLCNCNFSTGFIVEVQSESLDGATLYTVAVCQNSKRYILATDVLASDFTLYDVGQAVVVIPYYTMGFMCCTGGDGEATGCRIVDYADTHDGATVDDEDWRSSVRIIPWCGKSLHRWTRKKLKNKSS